MARFYYSLQFPKLHAYAVLLRESLGLVVDPAPDVPPLQGTAAPPDPELATEWLSWWRTILEEAVPECLLDHMELGELDEHPYALDRYPRLQAAASNDDHIRAGVQRVTQAWRARRPWPPPVPAYLSFADALRECGIHRWRVRRRIARKLGVPLRDGFSLIGLPVPGIWTGRTASHQVLLSTGLAQDYDAATRWLNQK